MSTLRRAPTWKLALLAALAFALLSVLATWPVAMDPAHLSVVRPDENDYRLNNYFIFWGAHALMTDPLGVHHTNMFHPERFTFVYADILLAHSVLMLPVIAAFYNPVLTFNLLLMLSMTIGAVGFFLLARQVTGHAGAAFFAATLWTFNPVHFTRYQQIQLIGDHWLPWLGWALWIWLHPATETDDVGSNRWAVLAAVFFCLNALSGSHTAVFGALLAAVMLGYFAVVRSLWRRRSFVVGVAIFAIIVLAALAPIFWPYLSVEKQIAESRAQTLDLSNASLRPLELFSARSRFYLWLDRTVGWPSMVNMSGRELRAYAFPGIVVLALATLGIVTPRRDRYRQRRLWIILLALFVFLAMGSYGGYALLGNLPVFRLIRVPTRFMMPAILALAMLAAYGAAGLAERLPTTRRRVAVFAALGLLFAAEASFARLRTWQYEQETRPLNEFLAAQPGDFAVVEFPLDPFGYAINMRQVHNSMFHWKRLLVGYSGFQSQENVELLRRVRDRFPSDDCLDELHALDVRFVVVLAGRVEAAFLEAVDSQPRLAAAWSYDDWQVYRILP